MEHSVHQGSALKTWLIVIFCVAIVVFQGWLAFTVIGDHGQPDWDYRPMEDVPGESAHAIFDPYFPLPYAQHVRKEQGQEENPQHLYVLPFEGVE